LLCNSPHLLLSSVAVKNDLPLGLTAAGDRQVLLSTAARWIKPQTEKANGDDAARAVRSWIGC
jgi:hypothetical protein